MEVLPLLQGLVDDFALAAQKKQISVCLSGDEAQIMGIPVLLREMFFNLIDNAVKYTPNGGSVGAAREGKIVCYPESEITEATISKS